MTLSMHRRGPAPMSYRKSHELPRFAHQDLRLHSMATEKNSTWERRTWPEMKRLATEVPEAGIHLLSE